MIARISPWARRQPVVAFYILAFAITWSGWILKAAYSRGFFPFDSPLFYILGGRAAPEASASPVVGEEA